jgi:hypothetical protein
MVWISLIVLAIGATVWILDAQPPKRTMDLIYGMFLIGWTTLAFLVARPGTGFSEHTDHSAATWATALFLLSALVATSNNTVGSINDTVLGRAGLWDAELSRRYNLLKSAGRNANLMVPALSASPDNLIVYDISEDPNSWSNRCLAQYFDVASVRVSGTISNRLKHSRPGAHRLAFQSSRTLDGETENAVFCHPGREHEMSTSMV